jgi:hypothetical protein
MTLFCCTATALGAQEFLIDRPTDLKWDRYTSAPPWKMNGDIAPSQMFSGDVFTGGMFRLFITIYNPALFNEWWFRRSINVTMGHP